MNADPTHPKPLIVARPCTGGSLHADRTARGLHRILAVAAAVGTVAIVVLAGAPGAGSVTAFAVPAVVVLALTAAAVPAYARVNPDGSVQLRRLGVWGKPLNAATVSDVRLHRDSRGRSAVKLYRDAWSSWDWMIPVPGRVLGSYSNPEPLTAALLNIAQQLNAVTPHAVDVEALDRLKQQHDVAAEAT